MKVLYLGHIFENSSWSTVAIDYIKALSQYTEICWRSININPKKYPEDIRNLYGDLNGVTHVIQHVLPHHMQKSNIPCIGYFVQETNSIKYVGWQDYLDIMDDVWTANSKHLQKNWKLVPHCTDISKYKINYKIPEIKQIQDKYTFYCIGEFTRRKRFAALIEAFHLAFNTDDQVALVIKTRRSGMSEDEIANGIGEINNTIKNQLKLYGKYSKYIDPIVITQDLQDEQIYGLHLVCDCFVSTSFGEAWNLAVQDAMGFGNYVITNETIDYARGSIIKGQYEPCLGADQFVEHLHSGREEWINIDIGVLASEMRRVYENYNKGQKLKTDMTPFSHEVVGEKMYELLEKL